MLHFTEECKGMLEGKRATTRCLPDEKLVAHNPSLTTPFEEVSVTGGASCSVALRSLLSWCHTNFSRTCHTGEQSVCDSSLILSVLLCNMQGKPLEELVNGKDLKHLWTTTAISPLGPASLWGHSQTQKCPSSTGCAQMRVG